MGQKVNPIGFRTGVSMGWKSRWYAPKSNYGEFLVEDHQIRKFLDDRLNRTPPFGGVSAIEIERTREEVKVIIKTARPGIVIGPKGSEVENLKNALEDMTNRRVNINIVEVRNPDLDAALVGEGISEQLKRRASFRRTIKQRAQAAMQAGARGVKIQLSGRLGGAEMSRTETTILGSIPLHTLSAEVDYAYVPCFTTYGAIGVKVWIYRGYFGESPEEQVADKVRNDERRPQRRRRPAQGGMGRGGQARQEGRTAQSEPVAAGAEKTQPKAPPPAEDAQPQAPTQTPAEVESADKGESTEDKSE
jgi:small subunit ribosomal protein S3